MYVVRLALFLLASVVFLQGASGQTHEVVIGKELMITDLAVVDHPAEALDPSGAFHIRTLFEAMAPCGGTAKDVLLSIVKGLRTSALDLPARRIDEVVVNKWKRWKPDGTQVALSAIPSDEDWEVNWKKAPFRLTAIVNRIDLKENPHIRNAGEGRFVFCLVEPDNPEEGSPIPFTMILEYLQPAANPAEVEAIAEAWHELGAFSNFDQAYIDALKAVTAKFAGKGAMPGQPNHSALGQIRTNEIALNPASGPGWELREFVLSPSTEALVPATVKLTPHHALNNTETLSYLLKRYGTNLSDRLPDEVLGFRAITEFDPDFQWQSPDSAENVADLRKFSVNTCSGCHGGDARTADVEGFYQIGLREKGLEVKLSRFLVGKPSNSPNVVDPATGRQDNANFSDLKNRQLYFSAIVGAPLPAPTAPSPVAAAEQGDIIRRVLEVREAFRSRVH